MYVFLFLKLKLSYIFLIFSLDLRRPNQPRQLTPTGSIASNGSGGSSWSGTDCTGKKQITASNSSLKKSTKKAKGPNEGAGNIARTILSNIFGKFRKQSI